jgi:hypothetical protein
VVPRRLFGFPPNPPPPVHYAKAGGHIL